MPAASVATATRESDDPRDAVDPRAMMQNTGVMTLVAYQFLLSSSVSSYFMYGAGSLALADQPAWVGETFDPGTAGDRRRAAPRWRLRRRRDGRVRIRRGLRWAGFGGGGFDGGGGWLSGPVRR